MLTTMVMALALSTADPPNPPAELPVKAQRQADVRHERPLAVAGELGWNSLAGLGVNLAYHPLPHLSLDLGLGIGGTGYKAGLRGRANLMLSNLTPFVGAAFMVGSGSVGESIRLEEEDNVIRYKVAFSPYAAAVGGLEYVGDGGFTFLLSLGYAWLLADNLTITRGTPSKTQKQALDAVLGSGMVFALAFGYAFDL